MSSDVLHVYEHAELFASPFAPEPLNEIFDRLEQRAREQLREEGFDERSIELSRFNDMRFSLQIHQVEMPVPARTLAEADMDELVDGFVDRYESIYGKGSAFTGAGVQIGVFRVLGRGKIRTPGLPKLEPKGKAAPVSRRDVYWDGVGFQPTDIYDGAALGPGAELEGPTVVEMDSTTVVIHPGQRGRVDEYGSFVITV